MSAVTSLSLTISLSICCSSELNLSQPLPQASLASFVISYCLSDSNLEIYLSITSSEYPESFPICRNASVASSLALIGSAFLTLEIASFVACNRSSSIKLFDFLAVALTTSSAFFPEVFATNAKSSVCFNTSPASPIRPCVSNASPNPSRASAPQSPSLISYEQSLIPVTTPNASPNPGTRETPMFKTAASLESPPYGL